MSLLAINWQPELRGILIVIIAVAVLMGSIFMILSTNLGARLGFLVAMSALAGWMFIMGAIWWSYGKGLLGPEASWAPVEGRTVLQTPAALSEAGVLRSSIEGADDPTDAAAKVADELKAQGWHQLDSSLPSYQQSFAAASVFLEETGALSAGQFQVVNVFDKGGERYPKIGESFDFFAFLHKARYSVVEVAPLIPQREEPGRAPAKAQIDTTKPHQYVYMIRNLGAKRKPAGFITFGSLVVFLILCWLMHRRDRFVAANRAAVALPARV